MPKSTFTRVRRKIDILRHEAGHLVIAKLLGFETGEIRFGQKDAGAGITLVPDLRDIEAIKQYVARRVVVLYAGVAAEALRGVTIDQQQALKDFSSEVGMNDFAKIRELLLLLAGLESEDDDRQKLLDKYVEQYANRTGELVQKHALTIHEVAKELAAGIPAAGGHLSQSQVDALSSVKKIEVGSEL
ncbi:MULTISPECIES: hypothetical protein [unclassified Bradyrhizobium]|uniref:hypothetical protein n=1 Tax=unclassified Bradyrhizobium TaxID=2631580 RepID=UPI002916C110|nr:MULTISPECIES: hypothetical protein [unclassified Bradyrhizobium]